MQQRNDFCKKKSQYRSVILNTKAKKEKVEQALKFMQDRHPFLRAYLDIRRDEDRMCLVMLEKQDEYREKIELEWTTAESREDVIKLNAAFNAKLFQDKSVPKILNFKRVNTFYC